MMMASERDPRTDPRPGDVLTKGPKVTYQVRRRDDGRVYYTRTIVDHIPLDRWKQITDNARVVARGGEGGGP